MPAGTTPALFHRLGQHRRRLAVAICTGLVTGAVSHAQVTILHPFAGGPSDGESPYTSLTLSGSYLYGTTRYGGSDGDGVLYRIDTDGTGYTILHQFNGNTDGEFPGALTISGSMIYGSADYAGPTGLGTAFSMDTDGSGFTVIHDFTGGPTDGSFPASALTISGSTLYGTTATGGLTGSGGLGYGTVFTMSTTGTGYTILHSFSTDGETPEGPLILSGSKLYGTAYSAASSGGAVFSMNLDGSGFTFLHTFSFGSDGQQPSSLTLVGSKLYGVTTGGGSGHSGTIFSINTDGTGYDVVYSFAPSSISGLDPGSLTYANGRLYGTSDGSGTDGKGEIYSINLDGTGFTLIHSFMDSPDGAFGGAGLATSNNGGTFYGTTIGGGVNGDGTVFSLLLSSGPIIQNAAPVGTPVTADFVVGGAVTTGGPADNNTINSLLFQSGGTLTINNTLTLASGNVTTNGGTTSINGGTLSGSNGLNFDVEGNLTVGSTLAGSGVTKSGSGVLTLTSSNTYSGGTQVTAGVLAVGNNNALGAGAVTLSTGTELRGVGTVTLPNTVNFASGMTVATVSATTGSTFTLTSLDATNLSALTIGSAGNTGTVSVAPSAVTNNSGVATIEVAFGTLRNGGGLSGLTGSAASTTVDWGATLAVNDLNLTVTALQGNGAVTLGTKTTTTLTLQGTADFAGVISGAGQVTIGGSVTFTGTNTYTGGTSLLPNASLDLGGGTSAGSLMGNIALGDSTSVLKFDRTNTDSFAGVISGAGVVEQIGGGVLTLSGNNTYSGGTQINSGVVVITNANELGTGAVTLGGVGTELRSNGTFTLANLVNFASSPATPGGAISTTGTLTLASLDGTNATQLFFGSTGNAGTVVVNSASNAPSTLDVEVRNGTLRNGGGLSGLTGAANSTTVDSGATLALNDLSLTVNALQGNGSVTLGTKAVTTLTLPGSSVFAGVISGAGQVNISGDMTFTGANTYAGGTTIAPQSSLDLGNGITGPGTSGSLVGNVTVGSDGALIFDRNNNYTFGGVISGAGNVLQVGAGVLTLTGHNTYSGGTLVDFGVLAFSNASVLGTGPIRVQDGGELRATGTTVVNSPVKVARFDEDTISATAGSTLTINNLDARQDTVLFGSPGNTGTVLIGPGATTTCTTGLVVQYGTLGNTGGLGALTANSPAMLVYPGAKLALNDFSITLSNIATGPGSLVNLGTKATTVLTLTALADIEGVISGPGSVIVAGQAHFLGANTYTGGTTVAANSSLDLGGQFTAGSVMGNIALSDSTATLLFDRANAYNFNGVISGPGSVQQIGGGVLTLTNSNPYSGGTEISLGVLAISNSNALGTGSVTLDDGAELRAIYPPSGTALPTPFVGGASVTLNNTVQFASGTNNATLSAATNRIFVLNSLDTSNTAAVTFGSAANTGTVIIGPGVTVGSGPLAITVADGTLQNGGGLGTLTNDTTVTINAGAKLALNDINTTVFKLVGSGSVNLGTKAATVLTLDYANYAGVISGAGHVNANGAGVNFQTANTYTGGTTVSQGSLVATNTSGSATGSGPVAINNGGTIGGSGTVSGAMTLNNGGLIEPGVNSPTVAGTKFHGSSLLWNAGGALSFQIGSTPDELLLSGALTKGTAGTFEIDLLNSGIQPGTYPLVTFASTTFAPADFTLQLVGSFPLSADNASLSETSHSLVLTIGHSELPTHLDAIDEPSLASTSTTEAGASFVVAPTPEPTSATLLTVGLGAFLARRRRRG